MRRERANGTDNSFKSSSSLSLSLSLSLLPTKQHTDPQSERLDNIFVSSILFERCQFRSCRRPHILFFFFTSFSLSPITFSRVSLSSSFARWLTLAHSHQEKSLLFADTESNGTAIHEKEKQCSFYRRRLNDQCHRPFWQLASIKISIRQKREEEVGEWVVGEKKNRVRYVANKHTHTHSLNKKRVEKGGGDVVCVYSICVCVYRCVWVSECVESRVRDLSVCARGV